MIPFSENGTHYKITWQELIPVKIWRNSEARMLLAPFLPFSNSCLFNTCYSSAISGLIHGLPYLYSLQIWTFTNWNNFGRYRCCNQILVTFANFAKLWTVGLWAFFNFVLFRYERLQNLLFLVLIRCLSSLFYDCNENSCYFCDFCVICGLFKALLRPFFSV